MNDTQRDVVLQECAAVASIAQLLTILKQAQVQLPSTLPTPDAAAIKCAGEILAANVAAADQAAALYRDYFDKPICVD